jgi:hypothetical protein
METVMENKMQDSKREELRNRMNKHEFLDGELFRKSDIDGSWDCYTTVTEYVLDFITTEISKAREETLKEVLDYSKGFDYEFEACRATEKYLETELDKLKNNK